MGAQIIDGAAIAKQIRRELAEEVKKAPSGTVQPGLAVVLVGDDPASQVYVRNKAKACEEVGFRSFSYNLPASTSEGEVLKLIVELNNKPEVNGILVQLPLPFHINEQLILNAIDPVKDVDGFHPINVGRLAAGLDGLTPCTPTGCMILLEQVVPELSGLKALVIGRSNIVGKPMALLLLRANCTVTIAHSKTRDLANECRQADILVTAIGRPGFVKGSWIKQGAVVIDVGLTRVSDSKTKKNKLSGDVAFEEALPVARAITPVPGGVGPMTIACLLRNTLRATRLQHKWD